MAKFKFTPKSGGMTYLDQTPRLTSLKDIRHGKAIRAELYGEGKKKVSLPKLKFLEKGKE